MPAQKRGSEVNRPGIAGKAPFLRAALCGAALLGASRAGANYIIDVGPYPVPPFNTINIVTITGAASPSAGTRWLRWTLDMVSVNSSGCVCYRLKIN